MPVMPVRKHKRRRYAAPIGGMFFAFAALGVAAVIFICIRLTVSVLDNSPEKKMFGDIILPVVLFNPAPFEKATDIEPKNLLLYSMWSTLMGPKRDTYQFGENGELVVPASDLDVAAAKLFGPEVVLEHQGFGELDMFYYYDETASVYNVPNAVQLNVYTPQVEEITKNGEYYELYVGYVPSGVSWQTDFSGGVGRAMPEKYMNYVMQKSKDGYYIVKLQDPVNPNSLPPPSTPEANAVSAPAVQGESPESDASPASPATTGQ